MKAKLTATATSSLRCCPRRHYLRFELGLARTRKATPLRFGGAFHYGLELCRSGLGRDLAIQTACCDYATCPDWADPADRAVERETLAARWGRPCTLAKAFCANAGEQGPRRGG
jgi:hypothetical protein